MTWFGLIFAAFARQLRKCPLTFVSFFVTFAICLPKKLLFAKRTFYAREKISGGVQHKRKMSIFQICHQFCCPSPSSSSTSNMTYKGFDTRDIASVTRKNGGQVAGKSFSTVSVSLLSRISVSSAANYPLRSALSLSEIVSSVAFAFSRERLFLLLETESTYLLD